MGTKHAARSPAKGEDEFQELLLMTRQALFKGIQKELDHYRVTQFQDGKSGGLHLTEEVVAVPDAEIEFALTSCAFLVSPTIWPHDTMRCGQHNQPLHSVIVCPSKLERH